MPGVRNVDSNKLISRYLEYIKVSKKTDMAHTSNVLKACSNIICHIYTRPLFLRRTQKASPKPPRSKSIRWALMPFTPMRQHCRFKCLIVRLILNISANSWPNGTVQGRASISQTTPTRTSTHFGPNHPTCKQNGTLSLWGLKYLPPQLRYHTHPKSSTARIPVALLLIFKAACVK